MNYEPLMGIENEFVFMYRENGKWKRSSNFGEYLDKAGLTGDGSFNSYGGRIDIDGYDVAEINTPLIEVEKGSSSRASELLIAQRNMLYDIVSDKDHALFGDNTHYNFSFQSGTDHLLARQTAESFGYVLMLLLEDKDSKGVMVRYKQDRLEICAEYIDRKDYLTGVLSFLTAMTRFSDEKSLDFLPIKPEIDVKNSLNGGGVVVYPQNGILENGRKTKINILENRKHYTMTVQELLELYQDKFKNEINDLCTNYEKEQLERIVSGDMPLSLENTYKSKKHMLQRANAKPIVKGFSQIYRNFFEGKIQLRKGRVVGMDKDWEYMMYRDQDGFKQINRRDMKKFLSDNRL